MNVVQRLLSKFGVASTADHKDDWPSVVLLLKDAIFPSPEEATQIGQAAWGTHAQIELVGSIKNGQSHLLRCGKFFFSVNYGNQRYEIEGKEPNETQQRPWDEHTAWLSIDVPDRRSEELRAAKALGATYQLLLVYAFKAWSCNCLGVYFPAESVTIPNLGGLAESIQWGRHNGLNISFLD